MRERTPPPPGPSSSRDNNPFRPYDPRIEGPGASVARHRVRHGLAIFHDGNAGHFWRGEVASQAGDAVLSVGVILWVAYLTYSPVAIAFVIALFGLPWLLAEPFAVLFENRREPGPLLRNVGYLRAFCAVGLIAMHYVTIYPVVFGLVFGISLCGRLRAALRVAATHTCLAPGEIELVSNDLHIGASVVAVAGPLLATLLFVLLGERILPVAVGAAVLYFVAANSDGYLDAIPEKRRAFARVTLETAVPDEKQRTELLDAARPDDRPPGATLGVDEVSVQRERALPEWYQMGPRSPFQGVMELRGGLGLAGLANSSRTSLYAQGVLALVGGGMAVLEVFYVLYVLALPIYYVGIVLAVQGGGMVIGAYWGGAFVARGAWRAAIVMGMIGVGAGLVTFAIASNLPVALGAAALVGVANGLAVSGARRGMRIGFDGPERRALAVGEGFVVALCGVVGAFAYVFFYLFLSPTYLAIKPLISNPILGRLNLDPYYKSWDLSELFLVTGVMLALASLGFGLSLLAGGVGPHRSRRGAPVAASAGGLGATGQMSAAFPTAGGLAAGWDDESEYTPRFGAGAPGGSRAGGLRSYASARDDSRYAPSYRDTGYGDAYDEDERDDW